MKDLIRVILVFFLTLSVAEAQNIGINGSGANAHASALLDIDAVATPSLGVLIPRIALTAVNVSAPVTSPANALLLYNTASAGTGSNAVTPGFYYWNTTLNQWMRLVATNTGTTTSSGSGSGNAHCYTCDGF